MQFYVLGIISPGPYYTSSLSMEPCHLGEAPMCPDCGTCLGMLPWLPPYRAMIKAYRGKLGDVTSCSSDSLLVSARFKQAWEERGLKGIEAFTPLERIQVRPARLGKPMPIYYHIAPRRYGTRIDFPRSHFKHPPITCKTCQSMGKMKSVNGFSIDESTWTGEDMFRAWGYPSRVLVSHRVRQMRDDYDLKNMAMIPIEDFYYAPYEYPSYDDSKAV
jgi:hypothetical protein